MFYVFPCPITTADIKTKKKKLDMPLTAGVIHQVDVIFQDGCDHKANVQIRQGNFQIWPTNRQQAMRGNATVISFREFYELAPGGSDLHAFIWGDPAIENVEVIIEIGLLPRRIIQPMNFEALLKAAAGLQP